MSLKEGRVTYSFPCMAIIITLWLSVLDPTTATNCRPRCIMTHGLSVLDIPSVDTPRSHRLVQRLSVSDKVETPLNFLNTSPVFKHSLVDLPVTHIIPIGDTFHKMPDDRCLEGWPSQLLLLFLDRCVCHIALPLLLAALKTHPHRPMS